MPRNTVIIGYDELIELLRDHCRDEEGDSVIVSDSIVLAIQDAPRRREVLIEVAERIPGAAYWPTADGCESPSIWSQGRTTSYGTYGTFGMSRP